MNSDNIDLARMTVATVGKADINHNSNIAYMCVVCSMPNGRPKVDIKSPAEIDLLHQNPLAQDYLILHMLLPPASARYEKQQALIDATWRGLSFANSMLQSFGRQKIDVAYVRGAEPGGFWRYEDADYLQEVKFIPQSANGNSPRLMSLADTIASYASNALGQKNLDAMARWLSGRNQAFITVAPDIPYRRANSNLLKGEYKPF
jgi:hypothetical protein